MPRPAIGDYVFYKIVCITEDIDLSYVGSTMNWKLRVRHHKHHSLSETSDRCHFKIYQMIKANGGWDNFKMIELGKREQLTTREADKIEDDYRVELRATMNSQRAFKTKDQHKADNSERCKKWAENNKDKIKVNYAKYYAKPQERITCICGSVFDKRNTKGHEQTKKHQAFINKN